MPQLHAYVEAPVVGQTEQAVEQNNEPVLQVIGTHAPPLRPVPSTHVEAMHAGPEQVVLATFVVGQVRHAPPHERPVPEHVTGWHAPFTSAKSRAQVAATQVSPTPHCVVATPVVGQVAQLCPQARWPRPQVKAWQVRLLGAIVQRVPLAQVPQSTVREVPQPSIVVEGPHTLFNCVQSSASVCGVQPQTLAVPPPPQV